MSSDQESSFSAFFRDRLSWTRTRTISSHSSDDVEPRTQSTSDSPQGSLSTRARIMNSLIPASIDTSRSSMRGVVAWRTLTKALKALESSLEVFPPLKAAVGGLVSCAQHVKTAQQNQKEYRSLASDLTGLVGSLQSHLPNSRPARMPYSISNVSRAIEEHTNYLKQKREQHAAIDISLSTWSLVHEHWTETKLTGLTPAHEAYYDSTFSMEIQRRACTKNTRETVLGETQTWTRDRNAPRIYWMNGMAGTGKTTIAYSLCEMLETNRQLGGSYFCSRNSPECRNVSRIIPTLAYQLARFSNPYRSALCEVLGNEPDLARRKVDVQFKKLILDPLTSVNGALPQDIVVVIDALDECADSNAMGLVLDLVFRHATELPVKFFITSRPEPEIAGKIMLHDTPSRSVLHLHDIEKSLVQADIEIYLTEALAAIRPDAKDVKRLANRAGCLFIFAATVVRYIAPHNRSVNHHNRLSTMLQATSTAEQGRYKEVDDLYSTILSKALEDDMFENSETQTRQLVLWTVVCACEPLNALTLAQLLDVKDERDLEIALEPLKSILHISQDKKAISTLHASFPDFLHSVERSGRFVCNKFEHEEYLASGCFGVMTKQLRFNICDLESSHQLDSDIPDLETRIERAISSGSSYACRYWADHLTRAETSINMTNFLDDFLKHHFLFWMEALNLKGWKSHAETALTQVLMWLPKSDELAEIHQFVQDARNFATSFATNRVSLSTPHIYISALPFSSKQSHVWSHYSSLTRGLVGVEGVAMETRGKTALASWSTKSEVWRMALSVDGRRIVTGLSDGTVVVWDVSKGDRAIEPFRGHQQAVYSVAISSDGTRIASGSGDRTIIIWRADTGSKLAGPLHGHTNLIPGLAFSPNGSYLISGSEDHTIRMWDGHDGTWLGKSFEGHEAAVMSVGFSPDGKRIASGSDDRTIRVWDPETCATIAGPFLGHTDWIDCIAFSPDGQRIVSSSRDRTVRVWDSYSGETVAGPMEGHTDRVKSVAFSPDGMRVVSGSFDRTVCVWDSRDGRLLAGPFNGHHGNVNAVVFSTDGTRVYSGSDDRTICVWDARDGTTGGDATSGHTDAIRCVAFSPDGTRAASGSRDCTVCVWDTQSGALVAGPFTGHTNWVLSVAFSPDGARIVSGSADRTLRTWDASTGALLAGRFGGLSGWVWSVTFSPDGTKIASGDGGGTIRLWNSTTGEPTAEPLNGHYRRVLSVAFSLDGSRIVSSSDDRTVRMWDATDGNLIWTSGAHSSPVLSVMISPDGTRIVAGLSNCTALVLDASNGAVLHGPSAGPTDNVSNLTLSPDGASAVSVSPDRTVHVWEAQSGKIIAGPLRVYGGQVGSVAFSPDGTRVIAGWADGMVRVWDVAAAAHSTDSSFHDWSVDGDGWLLDSNSQRVVWVPSDLRKRISLSRVFKSVVTCGGCTLSVDDATLVGDRWGGCYDPSQ